MNTKTICKMTLISLLGLSVSGCASLVVGPVSSYSAKRNKRNLIKRSAMASRNLTAVQKTQIFEAVNFSTRPNEIAAGVKVNVGELLSGKHTWVEVGIQAAAVGADIGIYTLVGAAVKDVVDSGSNRNDNDRDNNKIEINGNNNVVNGTQGDENSGTSDGNESTSGGSHTAIVEGGE